MKIQVKSKGKATSRITSYDVARLANVSQSAVSRAFDPNSPISPEMRQKVRDAAQVLGWQPNSIARSLQRRSADFIGVITSDLGSRWRAQQIGHLIPALEDANYRPLIFQTRDEKDADSLIGKVMSYQGNAVILGSGLMSSKLADVCLRQGLLVISLNRWIERKGVLSVTCDHNAGARLAVDHLVDGGCRKLLFIGGREGAHATYDRRKGFADQARQRGVEHRELDVGGFTREAGRATGKLLAEMPPAERPEGVFTFNDEIALGILDYAYSSGAYSVPRDFALVGFDDIFDAAAPPYQLSTVAQPLQEMTDTVIQKLKTWIGTARPPTADASERIAPRLVIRSSSRQIGQQT